MNTSPQIYLQMKQLHTTGTNKLTRMTQTIRSDFYSPAFNYKYVSWNIDHISTLK